MCRYHVCFADLAGNVFAENNFEAGSDDEAIERSHEMTVAPEARAYALWRDQVLIHYSDEPAQRRAKAS